MNTTLASDKTRRFARAAILVLGYHVIVILWGAVVRVTYSGDGCGNHWPGCNGELVPTHASGKTLVEFSHRATSGIAMAAAIYLLVLAIRGREARHIRLAAWAGVFFDSMEAMIGMVIVKLELVAHNPSLKRAISGSLHLVNTFLLLAALTLAAVWALGLPRWRVPKQRPIVAMLACSGISLLVLPMSGAIAAFGDTVFHATSLSEGLRADFQATSALLLRLRVLHPTFAVLFGIGLLAVASIIRWMRPTSREASRTFVMFFVFQFAFGLANLTMLAPAWMQIVHLLLAQAVWISFVRFAAFALSDPMTSDESLVAAPLTQA